MLVIRMTRHGTKKRPFYHIVVADSRFPRDGRYIEKVGSYNPQLPAGNAQRVTLEAEKIQAWIKKGAQPSERVARFLYAAKLGPKVEWRDSPQKSSPKAKAQERIKAAHDAAEAAKAAPAEAPAPVAAAANAPAEAPAEAPAA